MGNFQVEVKFPDGKNLGITKQRIKVELVFQYKRPLSFTTRLEFIDEARVYTINVSGTTDNCLLTNYPYLQRMVGEYKIVAEEKKAITLVEDYDDGESVSDIRTVHNSKRSRKVISTKSGSSKNTLGYSPIRQEQLDESCESVAKWLNHHVLSTPIATFPDSVVEHNGAEAFELIAFLTGKSSYCFKAAIDSHTKRLERSS